MNMIVETYDHDHPSYYPKKVEVRPNQKYTNNRTIIKELLNSDRYGLTSDKLTLALSLLSTIIERLVIDQGSSITIDDVGTFRPILRNKNGKRIGIQFRVKPSLLKPLEGAEAIVTKVTKVDGKERELESRYTQSYRPKKAEG